MIFDNIIKGGKNKMEKTIKVKIREVYGVERIYPVNFIEELEVLTGTKTLTRKHIKALKSLGFTFEVINNVSV